jgi:hypothetical protein
MFEAAAASRWGGGCGNRGIVTRYPCSPANIFLNRKAMGMANCDLPDQIARLEVDIEQLAETLERCRKAMLVAKVAIGAGAIWILAYAIGVVMFGPATMIGAIAAVIGGVVLYGSNASTSKEAAAAMKDAQRLRGELIDKVDLRTVDGSAINSFSE